MLRVCSARVHQPLRALQLHRHQLHQFAQGFDHLLLDVNLPGRSGPDFAAEALRTQPWLRLIFVSGEGRIESNLPARSLPKPFSFDQLAEILQG